ncbi:hypothetical protein BDD12DRAFT_802478 [Trichophaea hybrida]|nr:hypothetical protein BDD12DRAFT_802478 [Trichophaea hybrida]
MTTFQETDIAELEIHSEVWSFQHTANVSFSAQLTECQRPGLRLTVELNPLLSWLKQKVDWYQLRSADWFTKLTYPQRSRLIYETVDLFAKPISSQFSRNTYNGQLSRDNRSEVVTKTITRPSDILGIPAIGFIDTTSQTGKTKDAKNDKMKQGKKVRFQGGR